MSFLTGLFGDQNTTVNMIIALVIVIILIVLVVWLIKLLSERSYTVGRGRNRRLTIVDAIALDQKRQALIIRRDNVEHLIITGGPNDLVVETGFTYTEEAQPQQKPSFPFQRKAAAAAAASPESAPVAPSVSLTPVFSTKEKPSVDSEVKIAPSTLTDSVKVDASKSADSSIDVSIEGVKDDSKLGSKS